MLKNRKKKPETNSISVSSGQLSFFIESLNGVVLKKNRFKNLPINRSRRVILDLVVFQKAEMDVFLETLRHDA